jgi:thiamine-phosphate diphosphorylase
LRAIALSKRFGFQLFINDAWRLALSLVALGVHLGQEDLLDADLPALAAAGLRLGISTHCYREIARARAVRPSYIALGPVYETSLKKMSYGPLGTAVLRRLRACLAEPLVAIGGISLPQAKEVLPCVEASSWSQPLPWRKTPKKPSANGFSSTPAGLSQRKPRPTRAP